MTPSSRPSILVHGGAGKRGVDDDGAAREAGCRRAAAAGYAVLHAGGSSLDAVERAVAVLEDDPLFNAGHGAALTRDGSVELDAAVMEGSQLRAGAVGALRGFANPVHVARHVLERSPHVLLVAEGAARFAREQGHPPCDPASLVTPRSRARLEEALARATPEGHGTVGAVACDAAGRVAAATSTGGITAKWPGRVGDSPLIGSGTYADDASGAASATGHGESIIRVVWAKFACDCVRAGASVEEAAERALREIERVQGEAGIILIDPSGRFAARFNTERMAHAWMRGEEVGSGFSS